MYQHMASMPKKIYLFHSHLPKVHVISYLGQWRTNLSNGPQRKAVVFFRKNPVHGEEEAKLVLTDAFNVNEQDGNEMTCESSFNVEDSGDTLFNQVEGVEGVEDEVPPETPPATAAGSFKFHPHLFWNM